MIKFNRAKVVASILDTVSDFINDINHVCNTTAQSFAPSNIALVKYWGKSHAALNIPCTDSLSISLGSLGAHTQITILEKSANQDVVYLNNILVDYHSEFYLRLKEFLDLFRCYKNTNKNKNYNYYYQIKTTMNIPVAAGVASSACGFAALVLALDNLFNWQLTKTDLSILARLGSGSACRSLWTGFVYWQKGQDANGMDSYAFKLNESWPELRIGLILISKDEKKISSRQAMSQTIATSVLYQLGWTKQVEQDLVLVQAAIKNKDLELLGATIENNALAMHATMLAAKPAIMYSTVETISNMHKVWQLRKEGVNVYFTQDAGANLKLVFDQKDIDIIKSSFEKIQIVSY